jgi:hypothetical protein
MNILKREIRSGLQLDYRTDLIPLLTVEEYTGMRAELLKDIFNSGNSLTDEEFKEYKEFFSTTKNCPTCKHGELVNVGLTNCWPYESWECESCNQAFSVELIRDWSTLEAE